MKVSAFGWVVSAERIYNAKRNARELFDMGKDKSKAVFIGTAEATATPTEQATAPVTLTRDIYVRSRPLIIQTMFAGEYNKANRNLILLQVPADIPVDQDIDIANGDPDTVMLSRAQKGFTSVPSVQEGNPFNAQFNEATGQFDLPPLCTLPGVTLPGVPTYDEYIDKHGPFAIKVSVDADDYPVNPGGTIYPVSCVGQAYSRYFALKQLMADLVGPHIYQGQPQAGDPAMEPYNVGNQILLQDQTDADDTQMEDQNGVLFPMLTAYTARPNDQQRFGLVLKLDGVNVRAYWADEVQAAYAKDGIEGVKGLVS